MGVAPCGREQGRDGSGLVSGRRPDWDDYAFLHHPTHQRAGIFTPDYELAYTRGADAILFDRRNDPDQTQNLFADPAHKEAIETLTRRIVEHHVSLRSPAAEWLELIPTCG